MVFNLQPSASSETFTPDRLIAGDFPIRSRDVFIAAGENLERGALLGRLTSGGEYVLSLSGASDGSQTPVAILAEDVDATAESKSGIVYLSGDFNEDRVIYGTAHTADSVREGLRGLGIYLHKPVTAEPAV